MDARIRVARLACRGAAVITTLALLAACGNGHALPQHAVAVQADDACAVCGMYLGESPGPRGQAWVEGRARPLVFDSVRDIFAWVLQPEHASGIEALFVQDTTRIQWQHPVGEGTTFIDARQAIYVAWQPLPGSMGPTLAPFATRSAAEAFTREHGGAMLTFGEVTPTLIANLQSRCPAREVAVGGRTLACHAPAGSAATGLAAPPPSGAPLVGAPPFH